MKITKWFVLFALLASAVLSCKKKDSAPPVTPVPPDTALVIGKLINGGYVFFIDSTGKHGMVAATADQEYAAAWGCKGTLCGATGTAYGTGAHNTDTIVSICDSTGIAAQLCKAFSSGGYTDWVLPSKDELNLIYTNLRKNSAVGLYASGYYWSSSEDSDSTAWLQFFGNGFQTTYDKSQTFYVRAARGF